MIQAGGFAAAGLAFPAIGRVRAIVDIAMRSDTRGTAVWFDPIGVLVEPGARVRWTLDANVHTTTAYHPENDNHALRIPDTALPWDSGYLVEPGATFEAVLEVPGVYDYYCEPHEAAGMVGRIVVGEALGPATLSDEAFVALAQAEGWAPVPRRALAAFPRIDEIMAKGSVRRIA